MAAFQVDGPSGSTFLRMVNLNTTVDGAEIRRSPVEVGSLFDYLQGCLHPRWCRISSINSMLRR